jgi:Uma2 family endonuclease
MTITPDRLDTVTLANHLAGPPQGRWTVADRDALPDDGVRYELLDGVLYMTPAPTTRHQRIDRWFVFFLTLHVQMPGLGAVYHAPVDLVLGPNTVVQPDVLVVLTGNHQVVVADNQILGPPDVVIEIASPSTAAYDRDAQHGKHAAYAKAEVPEYWLAMPNDETIEVLGLTGGTYVSLGIAQGDDRIPSSRLADLPVAASAFFAPDPR